MARPRVAFAADPFNTPVPYTDFTRYVRQFKTQQLIRLVAKHQKWDRRGESAKSPLVPHAASLVAFEAMGSWGAQGQRSVGVDDLVRLNGMVIGLEDPILQAATALGSTDDLMIRVAYQQFPYQQPIFNDVARMQPMFDRPYPSSKFSVLSKELIDELLGTDVATYTKLASFFLAAVQNNQGKFDPAWFEQKNFQELNGLLPPEHALKVFDLMRAEPQYFRSRARDGRSSDSFQKQYDFNAFAARPFVTMPDGTGLAPQPAFVTGRFSPSAVFYSGSEKFDDGPQSLKKTFFTELGYVNEDYALLQVSQLGDVGVDVQGEFEYAPSSHTVDISATNGSDILLLEVKSTRPVFASRGNADAYREHIGRDIKKGFEQLGKTYDLIETGGIPHLQPGKNVTGFVVTPEPFYNANWTSIRKLLPALPFRVAILSLTELEGLVAGAIAEGALTCFVEAAADPGTGAMDADPRGALKRVQDRLDGEPPKNPILDTSFEADQIEWIEDS